MIKSELTKAEAGAIIGAIIMILCRIDTKYRRHNLDVYVYDGEGE